MIEPDPGTGARKRVILIDDHPIVATALQGVALTIPNLEFVGAANSCAEGRDLIAREEPDLAIIDMSLSDGDGLDLIQAIRDLSVKIRILVFSMNQENAVGHRVLSAGAHGYLMKGAEISAIREAISVVLAGETFITPELAQQLARSTLPNQGEGQTLVGRLTNREFQVFRLLGEGLTTREVSERLSIGVKTVESHRENIKNKIDCDNASQLILAARDWIRGNTSDLGKI